MLMQSSDTSYAGDELSAERRIALRLSDDGRVGKMSHVAHGERVSGCVHDRSRGTRAARVARS